MSFKFIQKLPTPDEIQKEFSMPPALASLKAKRDKEIRDVITGRDNRFLVIRMCVRDSSCPLPQLPLQSLIINLQIHILPL